MFCGSGLYPRNPIAGLNTRKDFASRKVAKAQRKAGTTGSGYSSVKGKAPGAQFKIPNSKFLPEDVKRL